MEDNNKKQLSDIATSISLIEDFTINVDSYNEYLSDLKTQCAVERQLGIIGEAVSKYDKIEGITSLKNAGKIIGFRNRLVHAFDNIDSSIVWVIIDRYLPGLKKRTIESWTSKGFI